MWIRMSSSGPLTLRVKTKSNIVNFTNSNPFMVENIVNFTLVERCKFLRSCDIEGHMTITNFTNIVINIKGPSRYIRQKHIMWQYLYNGTVQYNRKYVKFMQFHASTCFVLVEICTIPPCLPCVEQFQLLPY